MPQTNKLKVGIFCLKGIFGGMIAIYEHAARIMARGNMDISLIFEEKTTDEDLAWFPGIAQLPRLTLAQAKLQEFDSIIATYSASCYLAPLIKAKSYLYFNQSVESRFYSPENVVETSKAEATYLMDYAIITEATWIKNYVEENYNRKAVLVRNGINKEIFNTSRLAVDKPADGKLRVLIEGPVNLPNKNVLRAINICKSSSADEIWLLTSSDVKAIEGVDRVFSKVPVKDVAEIYRSCDVLVKLSTVEGMFGPPLEMFHCGGTAITYDVTGHDEYMVHGYNSLVVKMYDDEKIIQYINQLKNDNTLLEKLKNEAQKTAEAWPDWEVASIEFEQAIRHHHNQFSSSQNILQHQMKIIKTLLNTVSSQIVTIDQQRRTLGYRLHSKIKNFKNKL